MQRTRQEKRSNWFLWLVLILLIFLIALLFRCGNQRNVSLAAQPFYMDSSALKALQIPAIKPSDQIVQHTGYSLSYNEDHEQANWVAYVLTAKETNASQFERTNNFLIDPKVKTFSANDDDYERSGYDRGHLAPAEDMAWSKTTMAESFYYSNVSPQLPAFNRGVWKRLEELVRYWSTEYDSIYIATGPVLTGGLPAIGPNQISIPYHYYKVILQYNAKGVKGIGFVLKNEASSASLKNFAVSIDSVEHLTGINFFPKLPDETEHKIEADTLISKWNWARKK